MSDDCTAIDQDIASAYAAFIGARGAAEHSPSGHNIGIMEQQEERWNFFLDKRCRRMTREELDAAYLRPVRKLVTA